MIKSLAPLCNMWMRPEPEPATDLPTFPFAFVAKPFSAQDLLEKIRPEKEKVRHAGSAASTED